MNMRFIVSLLLSIFVLCGEYCQSGYVNKANYMIDNEKKILIGQSCKRDRQCIKNAYCRLQRICWCDETYQHDVTMSVCHATAGTNCNVHDDCKTMTNAECIKNSCMCLKNYFLDMNNSSNCIIRPIRSGNRCQKNDECIEALNEAYCINEKCECKSDYKYADETGKCIRARGLYQACKHHYECYDVVEPNSLYCPNGECVYKDQKADGCVELPNYLLVLGLITIVSLRMS